MHSIFPTIVARQLNASLIDKDLKTAAVHLATPCLQSGFLVEGNWFVDREGSYHQAIIFHLNLPCVCIRSDKLPPSCIVYPSYCGHVYGRKLLPYCITNSDQQSHITYNSSWLFTIIGVFTKVVITWEQGYNIKVTDAHKLQTRVVRWPIEASSGFLMQLAKYTVHNHCFFCN